MTTDRSAGESHNQGASPSLGDSPDLGASPDPGISHDLGASPAWARPPAPGAFSRLTAAQCEQLHEATLRVLARTGLVMEDPEAQQLMRWAGADVDPAIFVPPIAELGDTAAWLQAHGVKVRG